MIFAREIMSTDWNNKLSYEHYTRGIFILLVELNFIQANTISATIFINYSSHKVYRKGKSVGLLRFQKFIFICNLLICFKGSHYKILNDISTNNSCQT